MQQVRTMDDRPRPGHPALDTTQPMTGPSESEQQRMSAASTPTPQGHVDPQAPFGGGSGAVMASLLLESSNWNSVSNRANGGALGADIVFQRRLVELYNDRLRSAVQQILKALQFELPVDHILLQLLSDPDTQPFVKCRVAEVVEASLTGMTNAQIQGLLLDLAHRDSELARVNTILQQQLQQVDAAGQLNSSRASNQPHQQLNMSGTRLEAPSPRTGTATTSTYRQKTMNVHNRSGVLDSTDGMEEGESSSFNRGGRGLPDEGDVTRVHEASYVLEIQRLTQELANASRLNEELQSSLLSVKAELSYQVFSTSNLEAEAEQKDMGHRQLIQTLQEEQALLKRSRDELLAETYQLKREVDSLRSSLHEAEKKVSVAAQQSTLQESQAAQTLSLMRQSRVFHMLHQGVDQLKDVVQKMRSGAGTMGGSSVQGIQRTMEDRLSNLVSNLQPASNQSGGALGRKPAPVDLKVILTDAVAVADHALSYISETQEEWIRFLEKEVAPILSRLETVGEIGQSLLPSSSYGGLSEGRTQAAEGSLNGNTTVKSFDSASNSSTSPSPVLNRDRDGSPAQQASTPSSTNNSGISFQRHVLSLQELLRKNLSTICEQLPMSTAKPEGVEGESAEDAEKDEDGDGEEEEVIVRLPRRPTKTPPKVRRVASPGRPAFSTEGRSSAGETVSPLEMAVSNALRGEGCQSALKALVLPSAESLASTVTEEIASLKEQVAIDSRSLAENILLSIKEEVRESLGAAQTLTAEDRHADVDAISSTVAESVSEILDAKLGPHSSNLVATLEVTLGSKLERLIGLQQSALAVTESVSTNLNELPAKVATGLDATLQTTQLPGLMTVLTPALLALENRLKSDLLTSMQHSTGELMHATDSRTLSFLRETLERSLEEVAQTNRRVEAIQAEYDGVLTDVLRSFEVLLSSATKKETSLAPRSADGSSRTPGSWKTSATHICGLLKEELANSDARLHSSEAQVRTLEKKLESSSTRLRELQVNLDAASASHDSLKAQAAATRSTLQGEVNEMKSKGKVLQDLCGTITDGLVVTLREAFATIAAVTHGKGSKEMDVSSKPAAELLPSVATTSLLQLTQLIQADPSSSDIERLPHARKLIRSVQESCSEWVRSECAVLQQSTKAAEAELRTLLQQQFAQHREAMRYVEEAAARAKAQLEAESRRFSAFQELAAEESESQTAKLQRQIQELTADFSVRQKRMSDLLEEKDSEILALKRSNAKLTKLLQEQEVTNAELHDRCVNREKENGRLVKALNLSQLHQGTPVPTPINKSLPTPSHSILTDSEQRANRNSYGFQFTPSDSNSQPRFKFTTEVAHVGSDKDRDRDREREVEREDIQLTINKDHSLSMSSVNDSPQKERTVPYTAPGGGLTAGKSSSVGRGGPVLGISAGASMSVPRSASSFSTKAPSPFEAIGRRGSEQAGVHNHEANSSASPASPSQLAHTRKLSGSSPPTAIQTFLRNQELNRRGSAEGGSTGKRSASRGMVLDEDSPVHLLGASSNRLGVGAGQPERATASPNPRVPFASA